MGSLCPLFYISVPLSCSCVNQYLANFSTTTISKWDNWSSRVEHRANISWHAPHTHTLQGFIYLPDKIVLHSVDLTTVPPRRIIREIVFLNMCCMNCAICSEFGHNADRFNQSHAMFHYPWQLSANSNI